MGVRAIGNLSCILGVLVLGACQGTPQLGQGGSMVQGAAGPAGASGTGPQLVRCDQPVGTATLVEPEQQTLVLLMQTASLPSPIPALRLLMAQSGCFRVVDRGAAMQTIKEEEELRRAGLLSSSRRSARGRLTEVDYLITPNILFSNPNAGGIGAGMAIGSLFGPVGLAVGALAGSMRMQEAQTTLFLTDAATGEQLAAAEGSAKVTDFGGAAGLAAFGSGIGGLGGVSGYGNTAEGKLIVAAFIDAHNKLVEQIRGLRPAAARPVETPAYDRELVRQIQQELKTRGYYTSAVDGLYGRGTRQAIEAFQRDEGLSVTGQPTQDLLTYIRRTSTSASGG